MKKQENQILRKGYTYSRRRPSSSDNDNKIIVVYVPPVYIKDQGNKGKGPELITGLQKGSLKQFGYSSKVDAEGRHKALAKAVKVYGEQSVIKKLSAVRTLTKNTSPKSSKIFDKDIKWLHKQK